jgi:DNA damage-binding protein 1
MYLFALIRPDKQDFLMRLQDNIADFVQSPGGIPFTKYRAFRNSVRETDGPFRFVDGDLVERFLDCAPDVQEQIIVGLGSSVEDTRAMVEALRRLH